MSFVALSGSAGGRPTFFEMVAADRMMRSLKEAAVYSLSVFAQRRPSLHRALAWQDELFALVSFVLDRASLAAHAATFAETLYGLRRAPVDAAAAGGASRRPLTSGEKRRTLALLVLTPYVGSKMEALYRRNTRPVDASGGGGGWRSVGGQREGEGGGGSWTARVPLPLPPRPTTDVATTDDLSPILSNPVLRARLIRARQLVVYALVRCYPAIAAGIEGARFVYQASYLLDAPVTSSSSTAASPSSPSSTTTPAAAFFSPSLHLLNQSVVRVSGPELAEAEAAKTAARARAVESARRRGLFGRRRDVDDLVASSSSSSSNSFSLVGSARAAALKASWAIADHSRSALILAVFGFKLLEWWYLSGEHRLGAASGGKALPPPPPPPRAEPDEREGVPLPRDESRCPLCLRERTNPALAVCSGYVFCYPCLHSFVLEKGCCPVTRLPCGVDGVRRLFQAS